MTGKTRCGYVALIGAPNAGKSTLVNALVGQKVSIISAKPQTTRMRILGVATAGDTQLCLLDTPGVFKPKRTLDRAMVGAAWQSLDDADAVLLVIDAQAGIDASIEALISQLEAAKRPVIAVLNKVDLVKPHEKLLPLADKLAAHAIIEQTFMISALKRDGVADLRAVLAPRMPEGPWLFDKDQLTDLSSRLFATEITREQLYLQLSQELPYAAAVIPEAWEDQPDGSVRITQNVVVTREGQKGIVVGKGGARIKAIGTAARGQLEKLLGQRVHLLLEVKVDEKWQERGDFYRLFGLKH
ncbi:MAG: GTPase Era [Alphaproteobacteria bacterium]|nr:GTPase Era [Alphaproteobacteria bacterium]